MFDNDDNYGYQPVAWSPPQYLHASHRPPRPESLIDFDYDNQSQEEKATVAFGRGFNALGRPLVLNRDKLHLIPVLNRERIRFVIKQEPQMADKPAEIDDFIKGIWDGLPKN